MDFLIDNYFFVLLFLWGILAHTLEVTSGQFIKLTIGKLISSRFLLKS